MAAEKFSKFVETFDVNFIPEYRYPVFRSPRFFKAFCAELFEYVRRHGGFAAIHFLAGVAGSFGVIRDGTKSKLPVFGFY